MKTLNISLPDQVKEFVDSEILSGGYASANDYFLELLHQEEVRKAEDKLADLLDEGLAEDEDEGCEMTPQAWASIREEAMQLFLARQAEKLPE